MISDPLEPVVTAPLDPVIAAPLDPVITAPLDPVVAAPLDPVITAPLDPVITAPLQPVVTFLSNTLFTKLQVQFKQFKQSLPGVEQTSWSGGTNPPFVFSSALASNPQSV